MSYLDNGDGRKSVFAKILSTEVAFVILLEEFIQVVINPMNLRDTPFKRSFLGNPSVAVSFSLLQDLYKACHNFENAIRQSKSDSQLAQAYIHFAPSLQLFAQYAAENSKLLNIIKSSNRLSVGRLNEVVDENFDMTTPLTQPMQHCTVYKTMFQEYINLTPRSGASSSVLENALEVIITQANLMDAKIKEEEDSWSLLNLQSRCKFS